jgi:2-polyprenyl-6-methoxyphenol hydroxylase-like FAD-dependent oxidoreductase
MYRSCYHIAFARPPGLSGLAARAFSILSPSETASGSIHTNLTQPRLNAFATRSRRYRRNGEDGNYRKSFRCITYAMSCLLTVLQVGGSLAGLMNGIMLRHQGYMVTILEQDPATSQRRSQAAGITPGPDFLKFMEKYDRTNRVFSEDKGSAYVCAKDGSTAQKLSMTFNFSSWGLLNSILRANFDCHVSKACPIPPEPIASPGESIYLSGKRVTGIQFTGEKVLVQFTDVSSQSHDEIMSDLVIAADGSSSTIRRIIYPKVRHYYSGYVTWRGTVPESQVSTATSDYFDGCAKFFKHLPKGYMIV